MSSKMASDNLVDEPLKIERASSVHSHHSVSTAHRESSDSHRASRVDRERIPRSPESTTSSSRRRGADRDERDTSSRSHRSDRRDRDDRRDSDGHRRGEREDRDGEERRKRRRSRSRSYDRYDDAAGRTRRSSHDSRRDFDRSDRPRSPRRERDERRRDDRSRHRRSPSYEEYREPPRRARSPSPPKLSEEEREMRSVFVLQLSQRVGDRELGLFFESQAGKVRDARVIVDRISRRSKGVGYVEFVEQDSVQKALALSGTKLLGIPIIVQYTEAEKNRQARDGTGPITAATPAARRENALYVGSLNFALTEEDVRQVFQPFGEVESVDLHKDPMTGKSKGYAFVQFKEAAHAAQALEKMNNFPLAGREIKVGTIADRNAKVEKSAPEAQLEREDGNTLNSISRIELMQKLARTDKAADLPKIPMFRPNIPLATTRNVMMKDAFNPEEETERDWDLELREDVKTEVESKYGKVVDIYVLKESQGEIYIRFLTAEFAVAAVAGLNGRWFGGRQISAVHVTDPLFDAKKV